MKKKVIQLLFPGFVLLAGCGEAALPIGSTLPGNELPTTTTAPALPLGVYAFMGEEGVLMVRAEIKNTFTTSIEILSFDAQVTSGNAVRGAPDAFVGYQTSFGPPQNFKLNDASGVYTTTFVVGSNPVPLAPNQVLPVTVRANANTWDNLRVTNLHTRDQQINVQAEIIAFDYREVGSKVIKKKQFTQKGALYSLFRAIPETILSAKAVPGGYATQVLGPAVLTSAYTVTAVGAPNQSIFIHKGSIDWATSGLVYIGKGAKLPYSIFATDPWNPGASLGDVVASGESMVHDANHGQIVNESFYLPTAAMRGLNVPTSSPAGRLISVVLDTQQAFKAGDAAVQAVTTMFVGCEWSDGTREGLPCDPYVPVKGHIVTQSK